MWGNLPNSKIESLVQRLHERVISILDTARIKDNRYRSLLMVEQLLGIDRSVMTYKVIDKLCSENTRCETMFGKNLQIPKYNLEYSKKIFSYITLKVLNEIPIEIREPPTLHQHQKQLNDYLKCFPFTLQHCFLFN